MTKPDQLIHLNAHLLEKLNEYCKINELVPTQVISELIMKYLLEKKGTSIEKKN